MGCATSAQVVVSSQNAHPYSITFLGLSGVGKTSIIESMCKEYDPEDPPIRNRGVVVRELCFNHIKYRIYDVCGYTSYIDEWKRCTTLSDIVVFVIDPTEMDTDLHFTRYLIASTHDYIISNKIPIILMFNKVVAPLNTKQIHELLQQYFSGTKYSYVTIQRIQDDFTCVFNWIESVLGKRPRVITSYR